MRRQLLIASGLGLIATAAVAQSPIGPGAPTALNRDVLRSPDSFLQIEGRSYGAPSGYLVITESPNLPTNFEALSLRAVGRWEVCDGFQFTGECKVIEGRYQRRQQIGLRRISSARPVSG